MARQTEIVFSARDNGVESTISRIKQSANEMGKDLMREAQNNTSNAKDALKYYEDQIRLIEKRNRIEAQAAKLAAQQRRDAGISAAGDDKTQIAQINKQYRQTMSGIQTGSKEDQLQVELLRELIETTKVNSRDENRAEERRANADRIHEERMAQRGGRGGGAIYYGGGRGGSGGGASGVGYMGMPTTNEAGELLQNEGAVGAAGSMLGMVGRRIPMIAAAYGAFKGATAIWGAKQDQELQLRELAALSGSGVQGLYNADVGGTQYGGYGPVDLNVSREEFRTKVAPETARAYGSVAGLLGSNGYAMRALEVQKGMGVGPEVVMALAKMTRTMEGSKDAQMMAQLLYKRLDAEGGFGAEGKDMSRMQDMMQSFVEMQGGMFMRHGEMNNGQMVIDLMGRFEKLGGAYRDDQYKASTIQSLDRGLSAAGSPEIQSIKMGLLRQLNPEMGFFDLQGEMEKGVQSEGYLKSVLKFVRNTGGDMNAQKILFDQLTGGQMRNADVSRMLESGEFDSVGLGSAYIMGGDRDFDFKGRALASSSSEAANAMWLNEGWQDVKADLYDGFQEYIATPIVDAVNGLGDYLSDLF